MKLKVINDTAEFTISGVPKDMNILTEFEIVLMKNVVQSEFPIQCFRDEIVQGGLFNKQVDEGLIIQDNDNRFLYALAFSKIGTSSIIKAYLSCPTVMMMKEGRKKTEAQTLMNLVGQLIQKTYDDVVN